MSQPKFVLSLPGFDATRATPEQSVIHSDTEILKMIDTGNFQQTVNGGVSGADYVVTKVHKGKGHNLVISQVDGIDIPILSANYIVHMDIEDKQVTFRIFAQPGYSGTLTIRYRVFSTLLQ